MDCTVVIVEEVVDVADELTDPDSFEDAVTVFVSRAVEVGVRDETGEKVTLVVPVKLAEKDEQAEDVGD